MKRLILFVILPIVAGLAAAWMRANELCFVYDSVTGLAGASSVFSILLPALTCIIAAVYLYFGLTDEKKSELTPPAGKGITVLSCICGCALFAYGGFRIYSYTMFPEITDLIFGILTVLTAASIVLLGLKQLEKNDSPVYNACAALPVFWACYCLILVFRERISDPITAHYVYLLLAFVCILLFTYGHCGYIYGKGRLSVCKITAPLGLYFAIIELAAPFIGDIISPDTVLIRASINELAPLLAFALYMPAAIWEILKERNNK